MMALLDGKKTYISALVGIVSMLCDMYQHGPNPTNTMGVIAGIGAIYGRGVAKP